MTKRSKSPKKMTKRSKSPKRKMSRSKSVTKAMMTNPEPKIVTMMAPLPGPEVVVGMTTKKTVDMMSATPSKKRMSKRKVSKVRMG